MTTEVTTEKRKRGRPFGKVKPDRPVVAFRVDAGLRDQLINVAKLAKIRPSDLMSRILDEALNP